MAILGSLLLDIKMDTATLCADVQKVTGHLTAMGNKLNSVFSGVSRMLVGYGIYQGLKQIVEITTDAQNAQLQLAAAIKSTGGAAGVTLRQINELSSRIQETTTLEDDAVQVASARMLTFGKVTREVFDEAIMAAADLAARMGSDINDSAIQIGKALQDPVRGITALRRSGVSFSESQIGMIKSLVKSNDLLTAQKMILKELQTEFGGSAQALRQSLGGAIKAFMNNLGDVFELSPKATKPLVDALEYVNQHFEYVTTGVKALAGALQVVLIPALLNAARATIVWTATLLKNPFTALATAVTVVVAEFIMFRDSIVEVGGVSTTITNLIKAAWTNLVQVLGGVFKPLWQAMVHGFTGAWELIKGIAGMIGSIFKAVGGSVLALLQGLYTVTASIIKGILGLLSALGGPFKIVVDMVLLMLRAVFGDFKSVTSAIWNLFLGLVNKIIGAFVVIPKTVAVMLGAVYENFKDIFTKISNLGKAFWQSFTDLFTAGDFTFSAYREALKRDLFQPTANTITQIGESIKESFTTDYIGLAMGKIHEAVDPAVAEFQAGAADMSTAFGEASKAIGTDWSAVWGKIKSDAADTTTFDAIRDQALSIEEMIRGGGGRGTLGDPEEVAEWSEKYQELTETIKDQIDANREMARVHGRSRDVIDSVRASLKAKEEIAKLDIADTAERIKKTQELTDVYKELYDTEGRLADLEEGRKLTLQYDPLAKYADDMRNLKRLSDQGVISTETFSAAAADMREEFDRTYSDMLMKTKDWQAGAAVALHDYVKEATDAAKNFYTVFSNAFQKLEDEFVRLFTELKFDINSLLQSIQADITRAFVRQNITGPLAQSLGLQMGPQMLFAGPGAGGGMDMFGGMMGGGSGGGFGSLFGGLLGGLFGGFRAEGGPVETGKSYVVGERGPEVFRPSQPGTIIPNNISTTITKSFGLGGIPRLATVPAVPSRGLFSNFSNIPIFTNLAKTFGVQNARIPVQSAPPTRGLLNWIPMIQRLAKRFLGSNYINSRLDGARAAGGPVFAGGSYLVGERGPEVFMPARFGEVKPRGSEESANAPAGAHAEKRQVFGDIQININAPMDESQARRSGTQIAAELYQLQIEGRRNF